MDNEQDAVVYRAWRRSEAYGVPMTDEGMKLAQKRYEQFKVGFDYGLKYAMLELEKAHSKEKKLHSFYLRAKELVDGLRK